MTSRFDMALPIILAHEGGYVDHPRDPGGATNLGVTIGTLSGHLGRKATKQEVRALTVQAVAPIYRKGYWDAVRADHLASGVDLVTFDAAVNSGPARSARWLQRAVGVKQDGKIGPVTLQAAAKRDAKTVIRAATDIRLAFLRGLKTFDVFGRGWSRRVGEIRALGLLWAGERKSAIAKDADGLDAKGRAESASSAGAAGGSVGSGGVLSVDQGANLDPTVLGVLAVGAVVLAVLSAVLAARGRAKHSAADAMREIIGEP